MELPFYDTFHDFKEYYEDNLVNDPDLSRLELLRVYQKIYTDKGNEFAVLFSECSGKLFHLANDYNFYISHINLTNEMPQTFISGAHGLIVNQIVKELRHRKAEITKLDLEFISDHCKQYQKLCKDLDVVNWNLKNIDQILNLIAEQINFEKIAIKLAPGKEPETIPETPQQLPKDIPYTGDNTIYTIAFLGDDYKLKLFQYLADNFTGYGRRFTDLTKFNQIFFYLNYSEKLPKELYKKWVIDFCGFDYGDREIKGKTETHQTTLSNLEKQFKELSRN
ncbi:hypothetical protein [Chryseobacterium sp. A321]